MWSRWLAGRGVSELNGLNSGGLNPMLMLGMILGLLFNVLLATLVIPQTRSCLFFPSTVC